MDPTCTAGCSQPTYQVVAIALNSGFVTYPAAFAEVWAAEGITIWRPVPPSNYVPMGCVATAGTQKPDLKSVVCVHEQAIVEASLAECMLVAGEGNLWSMQNDVGTFEVSAPDTHLPEVYAACFLLTYHLTTSKLLFVDTFICCKLQTTEAC